MQEQDPLDRLLQPFIQPEPMLTFAEIIREQQGIRQWQGTAYDETLELGLERERQQGIVRVLDELNTFVEVQQLPPTLFPDRLNPTRVRTEREALAYWMGRFRVTDEEVATVTLAQFRHWAERMHHDPGYSWKAILLLGRTPVGWLAGLHPQTAQRWQRSHAAAHLHGRQVDRVILDVQPQTWLGSDGPRVSLALATRRFQVPLVVVARALDQIQPDDAKLNLELDHRYQAVADPHLRDALIRLASRIDGLEHASTAIVCRSHLRHRPTNRAIRLPLEDHRDPEVYGALLWAIAQAGLELGTLRH